MNPLIRRVLPLLAGLLAAAAASAQTYPARAVRIIIPFAAGGATDVVFRILSPHLTEQLGQTVVIDNRPGGGATIGMDLALKSPPDGYTLGVANTSFGVNPSLYASLPYDSERDIAPVSLVAMVPMVLAVHPSLPVRSVKELLALARRNPGGLNYGSAGNASAGHLAMELLKASTGIDIVHVPFKGGGPQVISAVSGETAIIFTTVPASVHHLRSGRLVGLGVSTLKRDPALPDVPPIAESGLPGYEFYEWQGLVAPAGTPPAIVTRLQREFARALENVEVRKRIAAVGAQPVGGTPEELAAFIRKEIATWAKVVKAAGIRAD